MGADTAPARIFDATMRAERELPDNVRLVLFATPAVIATLPPPSSRTEYLPCDEVVEMHDIPLLAIRQKRRATLVQGVKAVRGELDAFISCANTGALVAAAALFLPTFCGIERPALLAEVPAERGLIAVLDVGGMIRASARRLAQFAFLGTAYQTMVGNQKKRVRVGLLNIGVEPMKGTETLQEAHRMLYAMGNLAPFDFVGNIEPRDAFMSDIDVLVSDGFTGNVFVKTAEGVAAFLLKYVEQAPSLPEGGAELVGVDGLVMKCHGSASEAAIVHAIMRSHARIASRHVERLKSFLKAVMPKALPAAPEPSPEGRQSALRTSP